MKIRIERTRDRRVQHIYAGQLYLGGYDSGEVLILPQWRDRLEEIKDAVGSRFRGYEFKVGVPGASRYLPEGWEVPDGPKPRGRPPGSKNKKAAKKKVAQEFPPEEKANDDES